jgi:hypothetical protein
MARMRLVEDVLASGATLALPQDGTIRVLHIAEGAVELGGETLAREATRRAGAATLLAGPHGATVWRFELGDAPPVFGPASHKRLDATDITLPAGPHLVRCDSVAFPPDGCAYLHTHQGPGIRCLAEGGIRIDVHGKSTSYAPGGAWFENGPDPVFAQAANRATRFVRVMILPASLLGKSSIRYVRAEDQAKPKSQAYRMFLDELLAPD